MTTTEHRQYLASQVAGAIEEVRLVDNEGNPVGDSPLPATFTQSGTRAELADDLEFSINEGETVAGWRASGNATDFGGFDFDSPQEYSNEGTATLQSGDTYFDYEEVSD